jgi:hypothetical protein
MSVSTNQKHQTVRSSSVSADKKAHSPPDHQSTDGEDDHIDCRHPATQPTTVWNWPPDYANPDCSSGSFQSTLTRIQVFSQFSYLYRSFSMASMLQLWANVFKDGTTCLKVLLFWICLKNRGLCEQPLSIYTWIHFYMISVLSQFSDYPTVQLSLG